MTTFPIGVLLDGFRLPVDEALDKAVQVGAQNLVEPTACRDIILELPGVMERYGIKNLRDIIGGAH